jgi:hypothetical protein
MRSLSPFARDPGRISVNNRGGIGCGSSNTVAGEMCARGELMRASGTSDVFESPVRTSLEHTKLMKLVCFSGPHSNPRSAPLPSLTRTFVTVDRSLNPLVLGIVRLPIRADLAQEYHGHAIFSLYLSLWFFLSPMDVT